MYIVDWLIHKNHADLVMYIIGSYEKGYMKLYLLDSFHTQKANKLSKLNQSIYIQSRSPRTLMKRRSADMELSIFRKP